MPKFNQARVNDLLRSGAVGRYSVGESLYLVVKGENKGSWVHQYRQPKGVPDPDFDPGQTRGVGFGSASDVTLASALKLRHRFDPVSRPANSNVATMRRTNSAVVAGKPFTEALEAWLTERGSEWSAKGVKARRRLAKTSLGTMSVAAITRADVLVALEGETPRQHADKRGWLADLFSFAKSKQWRVGDNPARFDIDTVKGFAKVEKQKHHAAVAWGDLPALYRQLPDDAAGNALRFLILTAARSGEVTNGTWQQVEGENGTSAWVYTVEKGGKPFQHRVPLTEDALKLLGKRRSSGRFFGIHKNSMFNLLKDKRPDATVHGLRSTFKDWCSEHGVDDVLSEVALSHNVGNKVRQAYARSDMLERRRELMQRWAAFVIGKK